jgi:hypothetical protein
MALRVSPGTSTCSPGRVRGRAGHVPCRGHRLDRCAERGAHWEQWAIGLTLTCMYVYLEAAPLSTLRQRCVYPLLVLVLSPRSQLLQTVHMHMHMHMHILNTSVRRT